MRTDESPLACLFKYKILHIINNDDKNCYVKLNCLINFTYKVSVFSVLSSSRCHFG